MASTPILTMRRYFETWKAHEFDDFQAPQVGDDGKIKRIRVTFDPRPMLS